MQQRMFNGLRSRLKAQLKRLTLPSVILIASLMGMQSGVLGYHQGYHVGEQVVYAPYTSGVSSSEVSATTIAGLSDLGCAFCALVNISSHPRSLGPCLVFQRQASAFDPVLGPLGLAPKIFSDHQPRGPPSFTLIPIV